MLFSKVFEDFSEKINAIKIKLRIHDDKCSLFNFGAKLSNLTVRNL